MADFTEHYGLQKLGPGEPFSTNSYKFTRSDRDLIARLLYLGAEGHRHTGDSALVATIEDAPLLAVETTGGTLPPGTRLFYRVTLVDPAGFESAASPEARIDTAPSVVSPYQPTNPVVQDTGGSLPPGNYYYVLSAYTDADHLETAAENAIYISVPFSTRTNRVTFDLPQLPGGATGFNVYRRTPSGAGYFHIATINMSEEGVQPPTQFTDDGTLNEDCDRFAPTVSTARSRNSVNVTVPVDPVPAGYAWRIYRTMRIGDYANSLVATIADGTRTFLDTGAATQAGQPPTMGIAPGAPEKIQLSDNAEVRGRLPMASVSAFPHCETFSYPGDIVPMVGTTTWICPFPQATLVSVQASLGRDAEPTGVGVIVDVNRFDPGTASWGSIFTDETRPQVAVGEQVGVPAVPAVTELVQGDRLTVDIDQSGGDTDRDLTVMIYMYVYGWTAQASHPWAVTP